MQRQDCRTCLRSRSTRYSSTLSRLSSSASPPVMVEVVFSGGGLVLGVLCFRFRVPTRVVASTCVSHFLYCHRNTAVLRQESIVPSSCMVALLCLRTFLVSAVWQAGRRLEALYSEKGGVPVLFTSPYYVQLMDEVRMEIWGGSCLSKKSCSACTFRVFRSCIHVGLKRFVPAYCGSGRNHTDANVRRTCVVDFFVLLAMDCTNGTKWYEAPCVFFCCRHLRVPSCFKETMTSR